VRRFCLIAVWVSAAQAQAPTIPTGPVTTFGVTVYDSAGLRGDIYLLPPGTPFLPNFKKLKPIGAIYTSALNIPPRDFQAGFPGVTDRFEWFAIDYNGSFWIEESAKYRFLLASDDGSKLYIDNKLVIDNDGIHATVSEVGKVNLKHGSHRIRIEYFQGPRAALSLVLGVAKAEEAWRIFSTKDFLPPHAAEDATKK
jgi:hypothetical protein